MPRLRTTADSRGDDVRPSRRITGVERYSASDANCLYQRVWGPSFHFGLWEDDVNSIQEAVQQCKQAVGEVLAILPEHRILEVGSGLGETARYLANTYGCHVTASNVSEEHMNECLALTKQAGLSDSVDCVFADYHDLPFDNASFDAYVAQEALVHAENKQQVLDEAFRVLKPGGRLAFTDQTTKSENLCATDCARIAERHGSPDLYDAESFRQVTEQAGFKILESRDWSPHMARHFTELVHIIEANHDSLAADIDPVVIEWNLDTWRFASNKAYDGSMGWLLVSAQRPE